jgi:hypothetical protein
VKPRRAASFAREKSVDSENLRLYDSYMDREDGTLERALAVLYKQDKENLKVLIKGLLKYDAKRR